MISYHDYENTDEYEYDEYVVHDNIKNKINNNDEDDDFVFNDDNTVTLIKCISPYWKKSS